MNDKIRLGVSACLLGEKVRYDGSHQLNHYLTKILGDYVDFVPVCPEVELGLPTPRESLRLVRDGEKTRLVFSRSGEEITEQMEAWAQKRAQELEKENLDGFVFKSKSPSSGMERVRLYDKNGVPSKTGIGVFARVFMEHFPLVPVEEEGRLNDPKLRENFITSIFTLQRWRKMLEQGQTLGQLVDFHTRHKLLILAHSETIYREMGKLVAAGKQYPLDELFAVYQSRLMKALRLKTTLKKHANVLQHVLGYFKSDLDADEKQEAIELINSYRQGQLPLIVPITLMNHFVRKYQQPYLQQQIYLNPHPKELKLFNHI